MFKLKKIISLVILLALCVTILPLNALAYNPFIYVIMKNGEVRQLYLDVQFTDIDQGLLVYGTPQDVYDYDAEPAQSYDSATGEWRYYGFTESGFPFSNKNYPNDIADSVDRMVRDYVEKPWNNPSIGCPRNTWKPSEYQWNDVKTQLEELGYPPHMTDYSAVDMYWSIQFWPTSSGVLEGSIREWHWYDGYPCYETHQVQFPEDIGLNARLIVEPPTATVAVGETTDYKAYLDYAGDGRDQFDPEVTTDCVWSTADTNIGTIDRSRGRALGKNVGQTGVTAKYTKDGYDLSGSAVLIVTAVVGPITPPGGTGANDLIATNLEILDSNGNPVSGSVEVNKKYKVRATFSSTFKTSGYAKVRFYIKREAGWMDIRETENVFIEAESTFQRTWDWNGTTEEVVIMSSIDRRWAGSAWEDEKFNGTEEEITYENNVCQRGATGTETIKEPPSTENYGYPLYYHPVKYIEEPIIEQQPVIGWKKAIYIKDDTEYIVKVRLVIPE
ncbi:Ig-like domain-containing protein [Pelotomaculum propionicicum]|uniref:Ig-like domain-containing protein n=1 Tax=Pelotomaculum propionicicum TaxID=258475 RepID=UPI003B813107